MKATLFWIAMGFILLIAVFFAMANGDDKLDAVNPFDFAKDDGWFWAHVEYRHNIYQPNVYRMAIKIHPNDNTFPNSKILDNAYDGVIRAFVQIRGVDSPGIEKDDMKWYRPDRERELHEERLAAGREYAWSILSNTRRIRIENVEPQEPDKMALLVDISIQMGKTNVNFANALVEAGFGKFTEHPNQRFDWGHPLAPPIN